MRILLTGATGALGSELLSYLVQQGHEVACLVRAANDSAARGRLPKQFREHPSVSCLRGDITEPACGIHPDVVECSIGYYDSLIHCAASIDFDDFQLANSVNVQGTANALELASRLMIDTVNYVSTAYTCGGAEVYHDFEIPNPHEHPPRNAYESTKQIAETLVRNWAAMDAQRSFRILRPSILVGRNDEQGSSPTFDAFYGYLKPFYIIRQSIIRKTPNFASTNSIPLDLVIKVNPTATLNLVPICWATKNIVETIGSPGTLNRAHLLIHPDPPKVIGLLELVLDYFKYSKSQIVHTQADYITAIGGQSKLGSIYQRSLNSVLKRFEPYTNSSTRFVATSLYGLQAPQQEPPPTMDESLVTKLIDYACAHGFKVAPA